MPVACLRPSGKRQVDANVFLSRAPRSAGAGGRRCVNGLRESYGNSRPRGGRRRRRRLERKLWRFRRWLGLGVWFQLGRLRIGWLVHVQFQRRVRIERRASGHARVSVFRCELTHRLLVELRARLAATINHGVDQVMFVDVGPEEGRGSTSISAVGRPYKAPARSAVVV
jgi:CRISPR-associated protein Cas2